VHLVIRADLGYRDSRVRQFPETFGVPAPYIKHMMVVADLARGDASPERSTGQSGTSPHNQLASDLILIRAPAEIMSGRRDVVVLVR
jgi:hypothetical protein